MKYVGKPVERLEDRRFLSGQGKYVDDLDPPGLLHAVVCRSSVAHGRIQRIHVEAARAMSGVHAVYSAADIGTPVPKIPMRMEPRPELSAYEQPVLAVEKVRYVGEPLAVVIADSAAIAEDAIAAIEVDIESLPVVMTFDAAASGETLLFEEHGTNLGLTVTADSGEASKAFAEAAYVRRETFRVHRHTAVPMEARGLVAEWNGERLRVFGLMKVPFATRALLSKLLAIPESAIDAVETDVGSGFGMRGEFYPEDFLVPYAAKRLGRPVKWIEDRREHFLAITHARESDCELEIACTRAGDIIGLRGVARTSIGAYIRPNGLTATRNIAQMIAGPYRVPNVSMSVSMLVSNKVPSGSYRGPGRFEADFFRERLFDIAATELGIDRLEFRRRNLLTSDEMPYRFPTVLPFGNSGETDSGEYRITFDRCLAELGWQEKTALDGKLVDGRYHGLGVGCYIEGGARGPQENARLVLETDGTVTAYVGSSGIGQGIETIFAQIVADALEIPLERVRGVFHGSSGYVKQGFGTGSSRTTVMGGCALLDAAKNLRTAITSAAAEQFQCDPADVGIDSELKAVTAAGRSRGISELLPEPLSVEGTFTNSKRTYSYGTHAAHVAVDPLTGHVEVLDYACVEDVGRIINPHTLHSQVLGAITQGLGAAVLEHLVYDDEGQLLTASLVNYLIPSAEDFPKIRAVALEMYPSPTNPLGAKGAGEGGIIPVGGVIANAVASALRTLGVSVTDLPLSPPRVWQLIQRGTAES